jgi:hypothetical protein
MRSVEQHNTSGDVILVLFVLLSIVYVKPIFFFIVGLIAFGMLVNWLNSFE